MLLVSVCDTVVIILGLAPDGCFTFAGTVQGKKVAIKERQDQKLLMAIVRHFYWVNLFCLDAVCGASSVCLFWPWRLFRWFRAWQGAAMLVYTLGLCHHFGSSSCLQLCFETFPEKSIPTSGHSKVGGFIIVRGNLGAFGNASILTRLF